MSQKNISWVILQFWVLLLLLFKVHADGSGVSVKFLKAPVLFSRLNSATFLFEVLVGGNDNCTDCSISCKLDDGIASDCGAWEVSYTGLQDGNHTFEVCGNGSQGVGCSSHSWIVDMVPPTAYITASSSFTNALNVSVDISFTEPCSGRGGFGCSSVNACNLLVYGAGQVIPSSLITVQPSLQYSLLVSLSSNVQYGRAILVMDKNFCTDNAGNKFSRAENSSFNVHFDRRSLFVNLRSHVPEKLLQLNSKTRTVQATNDYEKLKAYLYFSEPVLNSSTEILNSLNTSQGTLIPIIGKNLGNRRFGFEVANISGIAIITICLNSNSIISRYGTPVSPIDPVTFLYDSQRPAVRLSTTSSTRTRQDNIPISIKFLKSVFGFNSSLISISGGHLQSFQEISRSIYVIEIQANADTISVNIPENVTGDVAGNKNLPSNFLQVKHYSVPTISSVISTSATAAFVATSVAAGLLTVSTASLLSVGAFSKPLQSLVSDPARNLFRTACHIQVFALSRWLVVTLPVEYYEFARGIQWSIPYFNLPWETKIHPVMVGSSSPDGAHSYISKFNHLPIFQSEQPDSGNSNTAAPVYGSPLSPKEYRLFFESQNIKPEADYLDSNHLNGWREFDRSMFWLAVIGGCLILLHALLLLILKFRKKNSEKQRGYGAVTFPRFEIFLIILAIPCICKASASLVKGGARSGVILGILLLAVVSILLLSLLLFLSVGITLGKLLQYKEVHQEGQKFHWYQDIVRVTLGPGKRGQWTWKNQPNSVYLTILGPLFEDLRGPPKYMLSQISGGNPYKEGDRIIASDDETEDAEAPFIQKLFGILRIYYTLLEFIKRVSLGILAGAHNDDRSSKTPTIILLCITSFQLFFMVLKKPFIKKKIQLVDIISVSCQVGLFTFCLVLLEKDVSSGEETKVGISMLILFLIGFFAQMINEWYALYRQAKQLDPAKKSFLAGIKIASFGLLLLVFPLKLMKNLERKIPLDERGEAVFGDTGPSADRIRSSGSRSSGSTDKPWLKQLREMAKSSFSKERSGTTNDPSSSQTKWSGFWSAKRSRSSSSSSDFKSKPNGLYRDLEAIFAAK